MRTGALTSPILAVAPQRPTLTRSAWRLTAALALVASACDSTPPRVPTTVEATSSESQTAVAGAAVPTAPAVRVLDQDGEPLAGVTVTFAVTRGGGSVSQPSATTGPAGVASSGRWTLGPTVGANALTASAQGVASVTFEATSVAGPPARVSVLAGEGQQARVDHPVATPLSVRVTDELDNPTAGIPVTFAVDAGGGRVEGGATETDADGVATAGAWTLGRVVGENRLVVTAEGGASTTVSALATAGEPASVAKHQGDAQAAEVATLVPVSPAVRVTDEFGNAVPSVSVTFAIAEDAAPTQDAAGRVPGAGDPESVVTGADGIATVDGWRLASRAGPNALVATVDGLPPVTFSAIGTPGAAASVTAWAGIGQSAPAGTAVAVPPAVRVLDAHANAVPEVEVAFAVVAGGGALQGPTARTGAEGVAAVGAWTLGSVPGPNRLEASVEGLDTVAFDATATEVVGPPASLVVSSGDGQSATVGTAVGAPLAVLVRDAEERPVPGVPIAWTVSAGGGTVGVGGATDASGVAELGAWTLGTVAGPQSLEARIAGSAAGSVAPVTFHAQALAGPAATLTAVSAAAQTGVIGAPVPEAPAVRVLDAFGNGVPGMAVTFGVQEGGGSVAGSPAQSASNGVATLQSWTLGPDPGPNAVHASAGTLGPVVFTAEAQVAPPSFNLSIESVLLNQGNQAPDGSIGGVAGRPGLLRVVVRANEANGWQPAVRVRLWQGAALLREVTLPAPEPAVPTSPDLDVLSHTWNLPLTGAEVVAGLSVEALVDPDTLVPESTRTDNRFPQGSGTASLDVQPLPPLHVVFVPIHWTTRTLTGNVTAGNAAAFLEATGQWIPTELIDHEIRPPYSTSLDLALGTQWGVLLGEIQALRTAEGATGEYYHGIIPDFSGIPYGGLAYRLSSPSDPYRSGLSYDRMPAASATVAHELGHNLGRLHAPCGNPGGPDPAYPYAGALIGWPGWDIVVNAARDSDTYRDYMSYCGPRWTSDYTYAAILGWRRADPWGAPSALAALRARDGEATPGLLVWGSVGGAGAVLNPAFALTARPVLPDAPGPHRLRGVTADGREVFRVSFEGVPVADGADPDERHFSFFLPLVAADLETLARIELSGPSGATARTPPSRAPGAPGPALDLQASGPTRVRIRWDAGTFPMALVRDRTTGRVLSFARGGDADVETGGFTPDRLEIVLSDGVTSRVVPPE